MLGFTPQISFAEGVRGLIGWVQTQAAVDQVAQATRELELRGLAR